MSTLTDSLERALTLPERTQAQLDELVRAGKVRARSSAD